MSQCPKCKRNHSKNVAMCGFCGLEAPVAEFFFSQKAFDKWSKKIPTTAPSTPKAAVTATSAAATSVAASAPVISDLDTIRNHISKGNFNQCIGLINTNLSRQPSNLEMTFYRMLCLNQIIYTCHPEETPTGKVTFGGNLSKSLFCDSDCKNIMINMSKNDNNYMKTIQYIENERVKQLKMR